jgi:hypothetical protein
VTSENRTATEALLTAFEALAERAADRGWPMGLIAEASFQAGAALMLAHLGVVATAGQCAHLSRELERLGELLAARDEAA